MSDPRIRIAPAWAMPERAATGEHAFVSRRALLRSLGLAAGAIGASRLALAQAPAPIPPDVRSRYPAPRHAPYRSAGRAVTPRHIAGRYNNFYEFGTDKEAVHSVAAGFRTRPWTVRVDGECDAPAIFDVDDLVRTMPLEERIYRFRCVEAWSMVVPWTGFPLRALLERVRPTRRARYVRFVSFMDPPQAIGQRSMTWYPWPYFEGLRMDEAMHELTLLATGIYGRPMPNPHGAPIRLVVPWKYGFKSIKSIVAIELTHQRPPTFWNQLQPSEYGFLANVDPAVPHPRWSQASERDLETGDRIPTRAFNGYSQVAGLYASP